MAGQKFEKGSLEFRFFGEFWNFVQKYYIPENNDAYWDALINESQALSTKYPVLFCRKMVLGFMDYIEEQTKNGQG